MDISSPETVGDAKEISDSFDKNPYKDDFEEKLSQADNNIFSDENSKQNISETIDASGDSAHIENEKKDTKGKSEILALNPTMPPRLQSLESGDETKNEGTYLSNSNISSEDSSKFGYSYSFQKAAENIVEFAGVLDTVVSILSGGITAAEMPNEINSEVFSSQTSITRSLDDVMLDLEFETVHDENSVVEDILTDVGQALFAIGSDSNNRAALVYELSKEDRADDEEESGGVSIAVSGEPPMPPNTEF